MEPFYPTSRKKCPEVTPLCENFLSDRILAMPIPKNRLHWTIFLVILVSLPTLVILLTRKNITLVIFFLYPSNPYPQTTKLPSLSGLTVSWRRGRDSNPRDLLTGLPAFQAGALGHYATPPQVVA